MKSSLLIYFSVGPNIFLDAVVPHQLLLLYLKEQHKNISSSVILESLCHVSVLSFMTFLGGLFKWRFSFLILTFLPCGLYFIFTFSAHFLSSPYQELGSQQEPESAGMYHYILKMAYLLLLPAGSCFCPSKCSGVWKRQLHLTGWPFNSHDYLLSIHNYYRWWFPSITISYSRL